MAKRVRGILSHTQKQTSHDMKASLMYIYDIVFHPARI